MSTAVSVFAKAAKKMHVVVIFRLFAPQQTAFKNIVGQKSELTSVGLSSLSNFAFVGSRRLGGGKSKQTWLVWASVEARKSLPTEEIFLSAAGDRDNLIPFKMKH